MNVIYEVCIHAELVYQAKYSEKDNEMVMDTEYPQIVDELVIGYYKKECKIGDEIFLRIDDFPYDFTQFAYGVIVYIKPNK